MKQMTMSLDALEMRTCGPKGLERLSLRGEYPHTLVSQFIFSQLGVMHLAAPHLPRVIEADFVITKPTRRLIAAMYASEKRKAPHIRAPHTAIRFDLPKTDPRKVAVSFSAGKDSLWNMWWTQEKYGPDNVLAVHICGLNRVNAFLERRYALRQQQELGFKHFEMIDLLNSSRQCGYRVMRSRDIFLAGIMIPQALAFGASKIITEGFAETHPTEPFSGQAANIRFFNEILGEYGIPVEVAWRNRGEMDVTRDLFAHRPQWVPYVCNCFAAPKFHPHLRRYWAHKAPSLSLYDSQCGSCVKCRITNLGRILYDRTTVYTDADARAFLVNNAAWLKKNGERLSDMIAGSFMRDVRRAYKKYDIAL